MLRKVIVTDQNDDWELPEDEEPSEEELAEAAALARALDRGVAHSVPEDALEAAALLRISQQPSLGEASSQRVWSEVESQAKFGRRAAEPTGKRFWLLALIPALAGAAAVLVLVEGRDEPVPMAAKGSAQSIPLPPAALLQAQADYMNSEDPNTRVAFEERMGEYRAVVIASLQEDTR
jgi:hypothetical protein